MIRISRLNSARYCGLAGSVEDGSSSTYALGGNAFHALLRAKYRTSRATVDAADLLMSALEPDARADVNRAVLDLAACWTPPDDAEFEVPLGIDITGCYVPYDDPRAITRGTADCVWLEPNQVEAPAVAAQDAAEIDDDMGIDIARFQKLRRARPRNYDGTFTLYVVDFKAGPRAAWNVPHPSVNLQLGGYGLGLADKIGPKVTDMRLGIYQVVEGKFVWARFDLAAPASTELWNQVRAAALRDPKTAVTGAHCVDCWVRRKCPAYVLPVLSLAARDEALAPLMADAGVVPTPDQVLRLLLAVKAIEDLVDPAKDWLKNWVTENGPIVNGSKTWGPGPTKGRESTSITALKDAGLYDEAVARGAVKKGQPGVSFTWRNTK